MYYSACISLKHALESFPAKTNMRHCHEKDGKWRGNTFQRKMIWISSSSWHIDYRNYVWDCVQTEMRAIILLHLILSAFLLFSLSVCFFHFFFRVQQWVGAWVWEQDEGGEMQGKKRAKESAVLGLFTVWKMFMDITPDPEKFSRSVFTHTHTRTQARPRHRLDFFDYPTGKWRRNATYPETYSPYSWQNGRCCS